MYQPAAFVEHDPRQIELIIREHPLANLVVWDGLELRSTLVPILFRGSKTFIGHLAKGNDLVLGNAATGNAVTGNAAADDATEYPALLTFTGPDAYVSPSAYPSKAEHGKVVPTWNYETVLVHGTMRVVNDRAWVLGVVTELTQRFERERQQPWSVSGAPDEYLDAMLNGIVGIEIVPSKIEAKRKLSQNRPEADRLGVIHDLAARGGRAAEVSSRMQS